MLTAEGFTVRVAKGVYTLKVAEGGVVKIDPVPGTTLSRGAVVTIVPSLGAQPIPVPDVGGTTVDQATMTLERAGFQVGDQQMKFSDTIGKGKVFYFRPGHETYPVFRQEIPLRVIENACRWLGTVTGDTPRDTGFPARASGGGR